MISDLHGETAMRTGCSIDSLSQTILHVSFVAVAVKARMLTLVGSRDFQCSQILQMQLEVHHPMISCSEPHRQRMHPCMLVTVPYYA